MCVKLYRNPKRFKVGFGADHEYALKEEMGVTTYYYAYPARSIGDVITVVPPLSGHPCRNVEGSQIQRDLAVLDWSLELSLTSDHAPVHVTVGAVFCGV